MSEHGLLTDDDRDEGGHGGAAEAETFARARIAVGALRGQGRGPDGRVVAGNLVALKTGERSLRLWTEPELAAVVRERVEAIVADAGGRSQVGAVKTRLVHELARLELIAESLGLNVMEHGVLTGKGKTRAAVLTYLHVLDRQVRLAGLVGLERRAKPATFTDAIHQEPIRG